VGRPVVNFHHGDSYEFFVFEKQKFVARRNNNSDCIGFDIQLMNDQWQRPRTALGCVSFSSLTGRLN
jgi:hypothetical protein